MPSAIHTPSGASHRHRTDHLDLALTVSSCLSVSLILGLTFADVFARYLFAAPIRGSIEIIEFAMALVIFSALPLVTRQRGHVTVSLMNGLLRGGMERFRLALCDLISALALGMLTWRLWVQARDDWEAGSATVVLGWLHAPLYWVMCTLAGLTCLLVLAMVWKSFQRRGAQ